MEHSFPYNPTLISMSYSNDILSITFRKPKLPKGMQVRSYYDVPKEIAYQWVYKQSVSDILSYYAKNIRKKYKLIQII